jgi:hypothetical protein
MVNDAFLLTESIGTVSSYIWRNINFIVYYVNDRKAFENYT